MTYSPQQKIVETNYKAACDMYNGWGVDAETAVRQLSGVPVSIHCWQGDDVTGLEHHDESVASGGIQATGNYPGCARTGDELRQDILTAEKLIPGKHHRINIHAFYAETGGKAVDRNKLDVTHFENWIEWAQANGLKLDFNPTFFAHPLADSGYTLSHADPKIQRFWIEHAIISRRIAAGIGEKLNDRVINNLWIPDGEKDTLVDRWGPRRRLAEALDEILSISLPLQYIEDTLESKLFGIGSESYVVGSHEFYLAYCAKHNRSLCLDMGHFHPTETIADKLSAVVPFVKNVLIHVSRGVRWDSDHVVILNDDVQAVCREVVNGGMLEKVFFAFDFFDASINRITAWVTGCRAFQKALLLALLQPSDLLFQLEKEGDRSSRLAVLEEAKSLPFGAVWDYFCMTENVPVQGGWIDQVKQYETDVLSKRQ